jgi:hypothetical protein
MKQSEKLTQLLELMQANPELVDNMTEGETRAAYNALPWKKAIFVDVHQYEEEPDAEV